MTIRYHEGDLPDLKHYDVDAVAIDTETLGLNPHRSGIASSVPPQWRVIRISAKESRSGQLLVGRSPDLPRRLIWCVEQCVQH